MNFEDTTDTTAVKPTTDIVSTYIRNNRVTEADLPALIASVFQSLIALTSPEPRAVEPVTLVPAISIKKSVTDDYIVCMEDGKKFKSLKRHLMTHFQMTPEAYRTKWKLPASYPMVAPNYAAARSALAVSMGLGRKAAEPAPAPVVEPVAKAWKARASRKMAEAAG